MLTVAFFLHVVEHILTRRAMTKEDTELQELLKWGVADGVFPGATCSVFGMDGDVPFVHFAAVGTLGGPTSAWKSAEVDLATRYDLASLTKMFFACMVLRVSERIALNDVPRARNERVSISPSWTVGTLLSHRSGLQAWAPLFSECPHAAGSVDAQDWIIAHASQRLRSDASEKPTEYSDLGYIVLGDCVSHMLGAPLDVCMREQLLEPLGIADSVAYRASTQPTVNVAPTERDSWRGRDLCGEVHDENCAALGGISAHAGLFGDIHTVTRFAQTLLNVALHESSFIEPNILRECTVPSAGSSYGTGFDTKRGGQKAFGSMLGDSTFGHLGFTGTSIAIDPERKLGVVLLSNRVHPTRENLGIREYRPYFHDEVVKLFG